LDKYRVGIVGATSLLGQELFRILEQRNFPAERIDLLATDDTVGRTIYAGGNANPVKAANRSEFHDMDMVFFVAGDDASRRLVPQIVESGATVIDSSSVFRQESYVPLVVPEVNAADIQGHRGIISSPNCSTIILNMAIYPLHKVNPVKRVIISTYQSVSGMGSQAMNELTIQTGQILAGEIPKPNLFPHEIGFNVLPQIDVFLDNGYTREEWQILEETRKILHNNDILVTATCVRVPTLKGHCQAVTLEFSSEINTDIAGDILAKASGIKVMDDTGINLYPYPRIVAGTDLVMVGRIRQDVSNMSGLVMWIAADNTRKGAALNMVQIAEEINIKGWLKAGGKR
jgi:aspartate-semialdehyde dehydrogenase